jgi:hypothetical protein
MFKPSLLGAAQEPALEYAGVANVVFNLDATVLSSMWIDVARTTNVSAGGQRFEAWDDVSGNGLHHVNAVTGTRPTYDTTTMTQNSVSFSGVSGTRDFLYNSTPVIVITLFAVFETSQTSSDVLFGFDNANNRAAYFDNGSLIYMGAADTGQATIDTYEGPSIDAPHLLTAVLRNYINMDFTTYVSTGPVDSTGLAAGTYVGRRANNSPSEEPFEGNIVELVGFSRKLTLAEVITVENHLNTKHSLGLTR